MSSHRVDALLGEGEGGVGLDMTPFVDIIFNLLLFFLLSTSYVQHTAMELSLPGSSQSRGVEGVAIEVTLMSDQRIFLYDKPIALADLPAALAAEKEKGRTVFLLKGDKSAYHGHAIEILDIAKSVGLEDIRVATIQRPPPDRR